MYWRSFIQQALEEDIRGGDHTTLSCIDESAKGNAQLHIKDHGILAGVELALEIFHQLDPAMQSHIMMEDGASIIHGQIAFELFGNARAILMGERLALNCMQRMSGIATLTHAYVEKVEGYRAKILDTRKTTPLFRAAEKRAVEIGGGCNHRFGLFDMIMIKDNHIDFAGSIEQAILAVVQYQETKQLNLKVEIEARTLEDVEMILKTGHVDRIMLDNFTIEDTARAVSLIDHQTETEASGGVTLESVREIASTGVDFISVGALTHSYRSLDLSLKAKIL